MMNTLALFDKVKDGYIIKKKEMLGVVVSQSVQNSNLTSVDC